MLDKNDKKEIRMIFNEGIQQLVLPILDDIYKNVDGIRANMVTKKEFEDFKKENQEEHEDMINSINRIETLTKSEIKYVDDLSSRVGALEGKKA